MATVAQGHEIDFSHRYTDLGREKHLLGSHGLVFGRKPDYDDVVTMHHHLHKLNQNHLQSFKRSPKMTKSFEIAFGDRSKIETGVVSQTTEMPEEIYFALTDRTGSAAVIEMTQGEASRLQHILKMTLDVLMTERNKAREAKRTAGFQRTDQ